MTNEKLKGIAITILGAGFWGFSGCFGQYLFSEKNLNATWLVTVRLIIAGFSLVLMGVAFKRKKMLDVFKDRSDLISLVRFSFCGMLLCQLSFFLAIEHSNAGTATVLQSLSSIIILIYICIKQVRLPRKIEVFALIFVFIGAFLLATGGNINTMSLSTKGLVYGLLSAFGAVLYSLLSIDLIKKYGIYVTVGFGMLIAGIFLMFITKPWAYNIIFDKGTIIGLGGVIVLGTIIAYSCFLKGVSMIGPFAGSIIGNIEPVVAIIVSVVFLGSVFTSIELIGMIMILATVVALTLYNK